MNEDYRTARSAPANREHSPVTITDLIRNLAADLATLLSKEAQLAKSEVQESVSKVQTAVGAIAMGAAIAMAGLVILLLSAVYALSDMVDPWLAALIVGAVALLIGYVVIHSARKKMSARMIVPERTIESMEKDKETLKRVTQ